MFKRLRGRNLRHPGCLIGITTGIIIGIVLAGILAVMNAASLNTIMWIWLGLVVGLGLIGWLIGARLTERAAAEEKNEVSTEAAIHLPPSEAS